MLSAPRPCGQLVSISTGSAGCCSARTGSRKRRPAGCSLPSWGRAPTRAAASPPPPAPAPAPGLLSRLPLRACTQHRWAADPLAKSPAPPKLCSCAPEWQSQGQACLRTYLTDSLEVLRSCCYSPQLQRPSTKLLAVTYEIQSPLGCHDRLPSWSGCARSCGGRRTRRAPPQRPATPWACCCASHPAASCSHAQARPTNTCSKLA